MRYDAAPPPRVAPAEPHVEERLEITQREVRHRELADLWNHHEPFARDVEEVRQLDVARKDQHELVAGPDLVAGVHGPARVRQELARRGAEDREAEDLFAGRFPRGVGARGAPRAIELRGADRAAGDRIVAHGSRPAARAALLEHHPVDRLPQRLDVGGVADPERTHRVQHVVAGEQVAPTAGAPREVRVQQVLGIPFGAEPRAHLLGGEPARADALAELVDEVRARLQELLRLLRRRDLRREGSGERESDEQTGREAHWAWHRWARRDSNPGPLLCESSALTS